MKPFVPWILVGTLAVGLVGVVVYYRGALDSGTAELTAAQQKYSALEMSSAAALKEANEKVAAAHLKIMEVATEAGKKVMEISAQADARTKAVADDANERLKEANLPEVTVLTGFRKGLLSSGSVAGVKNTSSTAVSLTLTATRPSTGQSKTFRIVVDPSAAKEIGEQEGWAFVKGDQLKVEQPGHKSKTWALN